MIHYKPSTDHPNGLLKALDLYPLSDYQYIYPSHPAHHYRLIFDAIEYCHLPDPYIRKRHFISNFCHTILHHSLPASSCTLIWIGNRSHDKADWVGEMEERPKLRQLVHCIGASRSSIYLPKVFVMRRHCDDHQNTVSYLSWSIFCKLCAKH